MGNVVKVSDMVGEDINVSPTGAVTGTIKYVAEFKDFSSNPEEQSGNYFPIEMTVTGSKMTFKKNGVEIPNKKDLTFDKDIVIRVTQGTDKYTVNVDGDDIVTFSFNGATLQTAEQSGSTKMTVMGQTEEIKYGNKKVSELMNDDVHIDWDGTSGKVTGTFKKITGWTDLPSTPYEGHFFAMKLDNKYLGQQLSFQKGDQPPTTTDSATDDDLFWILRLDKYKTFEFKSNDTVIVKLDFSQATLDGE